jgi:hypothetical protein
MSTPCIRLFIFRLIHTAYLATLLCNFAFSERLLTEKQISPTQMYIKPKINAIRILTHVTRFHLIMLRDLVQTYLR